MINLLPHDLKQVYRSSRLNLHLMHWITAFAVGIVGVAAITAVGYLYLDQSVKDYAKQVASSNQQLESQNLRGVQKQVKDMSNNLNLAVDVLSKQVLFSELLRQFTHLLPANTRLVSLVFVQHQGGVDITAGAVDYAAAAQLHTNLQDPSNKLFSKADIVSINCSNGTPPYNCNVVIRALFAPDNSYTFNGNTKKAS